MEVTRLGNFIAEHWQDDEADHYKILDILPRVKAYNFLRSLTNLPMDHDGKPASNSEIRRWLKQKAVEINGQTPGVDDEITYPVTSLVFFPNGKRRTTLWMS